MDTSRLTINTIDNSSYSVASSTAVAGFTVVDAPKGPCKPKKFSAGASATLKDVLGVSSKDYPELFEVETFNKSYDIYVSAPYSKAEIPVAYLTKDGVFASSETVTYSENFEKFLDGEEEYINELDEITSGKVLIDTGYAECLGGTNKSTNKVRNVVYKTVKEESGFIVYTGLKADSLKNISESEPTNGYTILLRKGDENFTLYVKGDTISEDVSGTKVSVGAIGYLENDTFTKVSLDAIGEHDIILFITGSDTATLNKTKISSYKSEASSIYVYWEKTYELKEIKAILFPKYPSTRAMHISFDAFNNIKGYDSTKAASRNLLKMSVYEDNAFHNASHPIRIVGTLDSEDTSNYCFNSSNDTYSNQELLGVYMIDKFLVSDITSELSGYTPITLSGGTRTTIDNSEDSEGNVVCDSTALHNKGWQYVIDEEFPEVALFFSSEQNMEGKANSTFFSIGTAGTQIAQYSGCIFNETPTSLDDLEPLSYGRTYWNVCNIAVIDLSRGVRIFSPLTGARALMQARIIDNRWGGAAPMWENANGLGGQLTMVSPYRMKYKYTKDQLAKLDTYNYNPIIMDRQYGTMVVGQRTCLSGALSDWSYIGHACAFITCIKEIRNDVMIPQIGKANNPYYRTLRKEQVEQIVAPRLEGNNRIWASAIVDTSTADGVNDIYARKALTFRINLKVQVDIYSEYVELNFTNEDQSSTVTTSE